MSDWTDLRTMDSENVALVQAILDEAGSYTDEVRSRNAEILKSIINNTAYTAAPQSEMEDLLIRLKARIGNEIEVESLSVTENGTYTAPLNTAYSPVTVDVSPNVGTKTITEDGTYNASDDELDGYSSVTVDVEPTLGTKTITANGTYNAVDDSLDGYSQVTVDIDGYTIVDDTAPAPIKTLTTASYPMGACKVGIEAVQEGSGTPSPDNVRPIVGWNAVNLSVCQKNILPNKYYQVDSTTLALGTETADTFPVYLEANENYVLSFDTNKTAVVLSEKCEDETSATTHNYINGMFNITSRSAGYYSFTLTNSSAITSSDFLNVMLEKGTAKTSYEAYNGQTYTETLASTNYGGYWDAVEGEVGTNRRYVDLGTLSWALGSTFYAPLPDAKLSNLQPANATAICSKYFWSEKARNYGIGNMEDKAFVIGNIYQYIYIKDSSYTDAATFTTAMSGVQLVYELATPTTTATSPRIITPNEGTTNIWADSGKIERAKYLTPLS